MELLVGLVILGAAVGYSIHLLRCVAINTAAMADLIAGFEDEVIACGCFGNEECELCSLPVDDEDVQLGYQYEEEFRGIVSRLDPEEDTDG